jgi:hypothetical protein
MLVNIRIPLNKRGGSNYPGSKLALPATGILDVRVVGEALVFPGAACSAWPPGLQTLRRKSRRFIPLSICRAPAQAAALPRRRRTVRARVRLLEPGNV